MHMNPMMPPPSGPTPAERKRLTKLLQAEKLKQAARFAEKLLKIYPNNEMLAQSLGMIYELDNQPEKAMPLLGKVAEKRPNDPSVLERLAVSQMKAEDHQEAIKTWQNLLKITPNHVPALCGLASAFNMLEIYQKAAIEFQKAHEIEPENDEITECLANSYLESFQYDKAARYFQHLITRTNDSKFKLSLADCLSHLNKPKEALALCDELIGENVDTASVHLRKGHILGTLGRGDEAMQDFITAQKLDPENPSPLIAQIHQMKITDDNANDYLPALKDMLGREDLDDQKNALINYALGKAAHDLKDRGEAFTRWEKGNDLYLKYRAYDEEKSLERFRILKHIFGPIDFDNLNPDEAFVKPTPQDKTMIFIVGMPRSGTSLVEQIISSHSQVYGAGELNIMKQTTEELMFYFTDQPEVKLIDVAFGSIGRDYMDAIVRMNINEPYVTDKMPHNFQQLGFIRAAFPNAKIIHINRDPMAVCWSNWQRYFPAAGMSFGNNLTTIGTYYGYYTNLMDFWRSKFGKSIYDLDYEKLTQNQEEETRALLDFCGLEFETACLEFHKTERAVRTASQQQVRQKMYKGSTKSWQAYDEYLTPLKDALAKSPPQ